MENAVEPAYFVPETIKADVLFQNMKKTHSSLAVVLDEYGGMAGIITLNDLVEELVGELQEDADEEDADTPRMEQLDERTWRIIGNAELGDIEKALGIEFNVEEVNTFTGLVFDRLNEIPNDGEQDIRLDYDGLSIHVLRIEEHQITLAEIQTDEARDNDAADA